MSCSTMREWLEECVKHLNQCFSRDRDGIIPSMFISLPETLRGIIYDARGMPAHCRGSIWWVISKIICTCSLHLASPGRGLPLEQKLKQSISKGQFLQIQERGWRSPPWNARKKSNWGSTVKTITTTVLYGFPSTSVDAPQPVKIWQKAHLQWQQSSKEQRN